MRAIRNLKSLECVSSLRGAGMLYDLVQVKTTRFASTRASLTGTQTSEQHAEKL